MIKHFIQTPQGQFIGAGTTIIDGVCTPVWQYDPDFAIPFPDKAAAEKILAQAKNTMPTLVASVVEREVRDEDDWGNL